MGHLGLCSAIILLGFAFLSTSADDRVYSQGISYQTTFALHVKPLGASQYVDTNLFQDVGDRLMSAGAVGVTNMNTYLIKYRFKIKQYDNLDNVVDSIESETKFVIPNDTVFLSETTPGWNTTLAGNALSVKWFFYIQEDINGDGDFNDAGEGEQEVVYLVDQYQPYE